jgi:hypothetical protein
MIECPHILKGISLPPRSLILPQPIEKATKRKFSATATVGRKEDIGHTSSP